MDKLCVSELCTSELCVSKLCVNKLCGRRRGEAEGGVSAGVPNQKNKNPTQRCGEKREKT